MSTASSALAAPHDAAGLRALVKGRLHDAPPEGVFAASHTPTRGDHDLNRDLEEVDPQPLPLIRAAAVLVPIVVRPGELTLLLTRRTEHLPSHAGQVAFPGGKLEPADRSPLDAALREAEEEIGLPRSQVEVLGYLDSYQTGSGYRIVPVVGLIESDVALAIDPGEVAEAFEVPLAFLLDPANHQRHSGVWRGRLRHYYAMPYRGHYVWGATAGMIRNLYERLSAP